MAFYRLREHDFLRRRSITYSIHNALQLVKSPESLLNLAAPVLEEGKDDFHKSSVQKNPNADIALLKLWVSLPSSTLKG